MTKRKEKPWEIEITFADSQKNGFVSLGCAGFASESEWQYAWDRIPASPLGKDDPSMLMADKLDPDGERVDERFVTAETVAQLTGQDPESLIEQGRQNTCFTMADFKRLEASAN